MYEKERIGKNEYCRKCKREHGGKLAGPFSFLHLGDKFETDPYKVLFVGKTTWDSPEDKEKKMKDQIREGNDYEYVDISDGYENLEKPGDKTTGKVYFSFIQSTAKKLYDSKEDWIDRIAITNIYKCNVSGAKNSPSDEHNKYIREICIKDFQIFKKELEIMKPKHIILLIGPSYDEYLDIIFPLSVFRQIGGISEEERWKISEGKIRILRTYHPVYYKKRYPRELDNIKEKFADKIVQWIKRSP